ncbi:hypothetical protein F4823DRAFT_574702 [Ustulina deusta]|nr:hypothetical protein F4823DRAFT_574702 [Ustulina deusta]
MTLFNDALLHGKINRVPSQRSKIFVFLLLAAFLSPPPTHTHTHPLSFYFYFFCRYSHHPFTLCFLLNLPAPSLSYVS